MRQIRGRSGLRLHSVLASEQSANVRALVHPTRPVLLTAYYGLESRVDLWDLQRGAHLQRLQIRGQGDREATGVMILGAHGPISGAALPIRDMALSPGGQWLALACGKHVRLVAVEESGQHIEEMTELDGRQEGVHAVTFSSSGDLLASASDDGRLLLWSVAEQQIVSSLALEHARLRTASFSHDDLLVATGDTDGNVAVWDVVTGHQMAYFQAHQGEVQRVTFGPHGYLLASCGTDGLVRLWDMAEARPFGQPMAHGDSVYAVHFHRHGGLLYSCSFDHRVGVWRLDNQQLVDAYEDDNAVLALGATPDDSHLITVTSAALKIVRFDHDPRAVPPPTQFAQGHSLSAFRPSYNASDDAETESVLVSDVDEEYLSARQTVEANPWGAQSTIAPAPPPPFGTPSAPPFSPGAPELARPVGPPSASKLAQSEGRPNLARASAGRVGPLAPGEIAQPALARPGAAPLTPARTEESGPHKPRNDQEARREAFARARRFRKALLVCAALGLLGAVGTFVGVRTLDTSASPEDQRATIEQTHQQQAQQEDDRFQTENAALRERLDRVKQNADKSDIQKLIRDLEDQLQAQGEDHERRLKELAQSRDAQLQGIQKPNPLLPLLLALGGGLATFALTAALAWLVIRPSSTSA
jgi:WD40 repeat protein